MFDTEGREEAPALTSALDLDIQRALSQGKTFAITVPTRVWMLLNHVVEADGTSMEALLSRDGGWHGLHRWRNRRALDQLLRRGYLRRDGELVIPTVRGIGAIRPYMSMDPTSTGFPALRDRRRQELAAELASVRPQAARR